MEKIQVKPVFVKTKNVRNFESMMDALAQASGEGRLGAVPSPPGRGKTRTAQVAPRAGAWIETKPPTLEKPWGSSPPARGRGLKPAWNDAVSSANLSPPARGRGLKPGEVRLCTDTMSRPPRGGVD